jgi:hypothetical protein
LATCFDTQYQLTLDAQNEKNIETILNFGRCVRAEQKDRIGKWSCAVSAKGAVIQNDSRGAEMADIIPVGADKFFATISEIPESNKMTACRYGFFWHKQQSYRLVHKYVLGQLPD